MSEQEFANFWKYYKDEPHQREAIGIMYGQMHAGLLDDEHAWVKKYRSPAKPLGGQNPLGVPYQSQNDNASGTGYRECFSSSCAMVAMYYGKIKNDDAYNEVRAKYGDSTDAQAQVRTLRSLGLEAKKTYANFVLIKIDKKKFYKSVILKLLIKNKILI